MKSFVFICLLAILSLGISMPGIISGKRKILMFDNSGYHLYLPAICIYKDVSKLSFYPYIDTTYWPTGDIKWYSIYEQPTGKKLDKYAVGSALFESPFFLLAHAFAIYTPYYPPDGYSLPYQIALSISYIFWCICGLLILRKFLCKYYSDSTVLFTLICITLGTNLFYQVTLAGGSHPYTFFLVAATLYLTQLWHQSFQKRNAYLLGIVLGLILIVRPVDIVVAIIPLTWGIYDTASFKSKIILLKKNISTIIIASMLAFTIAMLQMSYWKYITGQWIYFSYQGERFNFIKPHILNGLFSFRKGWFIYTPVAFVSFIGFYILYHTNRKIILPLLLTLGAAIYVVFSWENWWYGGGFASRAMVDFLPIVAVATAALINSITSLKSFLFKIGSTIVFIFIIMLSLFQEWQYTQGIIHYDRMTSTYYWRTFGKTYYTEKDLQYLMTDKEYWDAMRAAYD